MREIASLELGAIAKELVQTEGMFIRKFQEIGENEFQIHLSSSSIVKRLIYINLLKSINLTEYEEKVERKTGFATEVMRIVEGAKVTGIEQHFMDRILIMKLRARHDMEYEIVVEMFGKGNIMLLHGGSIISVYKTIHQKDRLIARKSQYSFPEGTNMDLDSIDERYISDSIEKISNDEDRLIKSFLRHFDFGPLYAEDTIIKAGLSPKETASKAIASAIAKEKLTKEVHRLVSEVKAQPSPRIYADVSGAYIDYSISDIGKYDDYKPLGFDSLSKALDEFFRQKREEPEEDIGYMELAASIEKQKSLLNEYETEIIGYKERGDAIFRHMHGINRLIEFARCRKKPDLDELRSSFPELNVKSIDLKKKVISIDIE